VMPTARRVCVVGAGVMVTVRREAGADRWGERRGTALLPFGRGLLPRRWRGFGRRPRSGGALRFPHAPARAAFCRLGQRRLAPRYEFGEGLSDWPGRVVTVGYGIGHERA
jgi:hypothetical protein